MKRARTWRLCMALALAAAPDHAAAQTTLFAAFGRGHLEPDPGSVARIVVADVDGDGHPDLVLRTASTPPAQVWYRNDGHAAFAVQPLQFSGSLDYEVIAGDVDGDGDGDLVQQGVLYRNAGGGQFGADASALPANAFGIEAAGLVDLDRDGDLDLLARAPAFAGSVLRAFLNDGTGRFTEVSALAFGAQTAAISAFVVTDADGDGDLDVVACTANAATGLLWRNDGSGRFTASPVAALPNAAPGTSVYAAADVDGDGDADLLVAVGGSAVQLLMNNGAGVYAGIVPAGLPAAGGGAFVDLDGDGLVDVAPGGTGDGWYRNLGGSQFAFRSHPPWQGSSSSLVFADLDGDSDLDGIAAGTPLRLLLNGGGAFRDAVLPQWVRPLPASSARAIRAVDARIRRGALPRTDVAWLENGQPLLISSDDPARRLPYPGAPGLLQLPAMATCSAVATFDLAGTGDVSLVACTSQGTRLLRRAGPYTLVDDSSLLHPLGTPQGVACGDLTGTGRDAIVLGAPDIAGPQILTADTTGHFRPWQPLLPPAPPSASPASEQVCIADVDGDGDLDLVHELRVIRNDGQGNWSAGAAFTALVPAAATGFVLLDQDGDGDLDVVVWTPSALILLENLGASFRDGTLGHLPLGPWQPTGVSVADVDRDGDPDLLVIEGSYWSTLLRNDRPVFTRFTNAAPVGVMLDLDQDLDPDLFDGYRILAGTCCQLQAPRLPALGASYRLDLCTRRQGPHALAAFVAVAAAPAFAELPPLGTLRLDPASGIGIGLPLAAGLGSVPFPIPRNQVLLGMGFYCQSLVLDGNGRALLTGCLEEVIR